MTPPEAPPVPVIPSLPKLKVFALGAVWAIVGALGPVAIFVYDSARLYQSDPIDWEMAWHMALGSAVLAGGAYWRKYRAWLQTPPPVAPPPDLSIVQPAAPKTVSVSDEQGNVWTTKNPDPPKDAA